MLLDKASTTPNTLTTVPVNSTWANIAWGFNNGGKDSTTGRTFVDLDLFD